MAFFQEEKEAMMQEITDLDRELQAGNPRIADLGQAILKGTQERALIEDALARLDQQVIDAKREVARKVIEAAQIVGATLTGLYMNPTLLNQEWDVVIVDEGSMAPPPAVLVAANLARAHLIVVGDPLQLAPVCKIKDPNIPRWQPDRDSVQRWLGRDIFHHGGYTLEQADSATHHSVLLPYQGRMDSAICDLIRGPVYKGRLKDRDPQRPRPTFEPEPESPVVLYDTSGVKRARAEQPASKSSRFNRYHAELSVHLAQLVLADFPERERRPECIGIVTPYAAHREVLKELVRGTELETYARIGTVHAFQGLEFDALIFDLVESPGLAIAPFLKYGWGSEAMRLMNVAVTRARHKLLIVANMDYIRKGIWQGLFPRAAICAFYAPFDLLFCLVIFLKVAPLHQRNSLVSDDEQSYSPHPRAEAGYASSHHRERPGHARERCGDEPRAHGSHNGAGSSTPQRAPT